MALKRPADAVALMQETKKLRSDVELYNNRDKQLLEAVNIGNEIEGRLCLHLPSPSLSLRRASRGPRTSCRPSWRWTDTRERSSHALLTRTATTSSPVDLTGKYVRRILFLIVVVVVVRKITSGGTFSRLFYSPFRYLEGVRGV